MRFVTFSSLYFLKLVYSANAKEIYGNSECLLKVALILFLIPFEHRRTDSEIENILVLLRKEYVSRTLWRKMHCPIYNRWKAQQTLLELWEKKSEYKYNLHTFPRLNFITWNLLGRNVKKRREKKVGNRENTLIHGGIGLKKRKFLCKVHFVIFTV